MRETAEAIHALLPQTQCTRCGYQGCRPYAEAVAAGVAAINRCPPGGTATIRALADLLGQPVLDLDPTCGSEAPAKIAVIDEERCIGCARCLPPCPVDAIVGAPRQMHTVLHAACTGCELCIAPCPVDCISLIERSALAEPVAAPTAEQNLARYSAHERRGEQRESERARLLAERKRRVDTALA